MISLERFLTDLYESSAWNKNAKYFLIYFGKLKPKIIFEKIWRYYIINIVIWYPKTGNFWTIYPFNNSCENLTPIFLGSCEKGSNKTINFDNFYMEKIPEKLNGCKIRLMGLKITPYVLNTSGNLNDPSSAGLEVTIMNNIARKMNLSQIYINNPFPHWGYLLPNGSFTLMYKFLFEKKVDFIFGMIIGNDSLHSAFEGSICHIDTKAVWFVPAAQQIAQWKNLTVIFTKEVWLAIFLIFIVNGIVWWLIGRKRETLPEFKSLTLCILGSFKILLQGQVGNPKNGTIRLLVITWTFNCLLLFTAHQCQLTGILTSPLYEKQIETTQELVQSNLKYGIYPILLNLFNETNPVHKKILNNNEYCSLDTSCLNRVAFRGDFSTIKNERQGKYLIPRIYTYPNGKPMVVAFKDFVFVVWVRFYTNKANPFLDRMDQIILRLKDAGLIAKWERDIVFQKRNTGSDLDQESLSLDHLQAAFYLLGFGLLIALIVFFGEKSAGCFRKREK